jgi:drug/metabolite transporter (DMT)-like permease
MTVGVKFVGQRIPSGEIVFIRSLLALGFTAVLMHRAKVDPIGNNVPLLLLRGLLGFAALSCFYYSIPRLHLADATVIQYTNPVFVVLFAALFLKERAGFREISSVALCLLGVLLIARPALVFGGTNAIESSVLLIALCGALLAGAAYTTVRKLRETDHALNVILYFPLVSVPASIPLFATNAVWPSGTEWLFLIGIGITSQLGQVYMTKAYHAEAAARASTASYVQIVFAGLWGILLFQEVPTIWTIGGGVFVAAGITIVAISRK